MAKLTAYWELPATLWTCQNIPRIITHCHYTGIDGTMHKCHEADL